MMRRNKLSDDIYRENKMTENFIRAFDALDGKKIMGIYGASHRGFIRRILPARFLVWRIS